MNESPALNLHEEHETPQERARRFKEEEEELEQLLVKIGASGDAADLLIEQLARKHKAEGELNRVFATLDDFHDYEQQVFSPSLNEEEEAPTLPPESEISTDESEPTSAALFDGSVRVDEKQEAELEQPLDEEGRKELVVELNSITDATIDEQRDIIVRYEADLADRVRNPKYTEAQYEEAQRWLTKPKELALAVSGKGRLMGDVKIPDLAVMTAYEQKVFAKDPIKREAQKRALSREEREAYRDAFGRKKDFVQALMDNGVRKGMAYGLYNEFVDRALSLERFRDGLIAELEAGKSVHINKGDPDYDLLKWHGIKDGEWSEIIDQINGELEQFSTIPLPPEPERPARVVSLIRPEKNKKKEEAVLSSPEKEEAVPQPPPAPLSGVYEVRDGHVYNSGDTSPDASRLDTDEPLPRVSDFQKKGGNLSGTTQPVPTLVFGAKDGVVTYDRDLDSELAREKETLSALMRNKNLIRPAAPLPQAPGGSDPALTGLYNMKDGIVRTGLAVGEGEVITRREMSGEAVDEEVSEEVINGWAAQGIVIPKGTKSSALAEILRKADEAVIVEDAPPQVVEKAPEGVMEEVTMLEETEDFGLFDPKDELRRILKAPTSERKALLGAYKEKLAWQKKGLAEAQAFAIEKIRENPDMTEDEFQKLYNEQSEKFAATEKQKETAADIFKRYQEKHLAIRKVRAEYSNDTDLFKAAFGQSPNGNVEVIEGPMTLYFRIHNVEDYALVASGEFLKDDPSVTPEQLMRASKGGGMKLGDSRIPGTRGCILIENAQGETFEGREAVLKHEEQHAINALFGQKRQYGRSSAESIGQLVVEFETANRLEVTPGDVNAQNTKDAAMGRVREKIFNAAVNELRSSREVIADARAGDEILAYTKDGTTLENVYKVLTEKKADGGIYDFSEKYQVRNKDWGTLKTLNAQLSKNFDQETADVLSPRLMEAKSRVFGEEYQEAIKNGLEAYQKLRSHGYAEEAIRAIFLEEPLVRWEKVAERLVAGGETKEVNEKIEINQDIARQFEERFGLHEADLEKIHGFTELSSGQQLLTLERMKASALEDINVEKVKRYRARINELSESDSWWEKLKGVGMKATKTFQLGRMKDEVSKEWLGATDVDGARVKHDLLEGLVLQALETKEFDVRGEGGTWSTVYISEKDFGENIDAATKEKIQNFNTLTNAFASKGFTETTEELKQQYELGAREMTHLLALQNEGQWSGESAAAWRTKLEGAVQLSRFFKENPDLDKELDAAGRNIGAAISFKNLLTERGLISGVSMGARYLGVSVLGLAAIPAVAAGVGGVMGWRRAKQEFSENDLLAQMGERDKSDDSTQKKNDTNEKDRAKNVVSGKLLVGKLEKLISEYTQASEGVMVETSARDASGRLMFRDIPGTEGKDIVMEQVSRKEALRRELEARVAYTMRKMEEELVDFGGSRALRAEHVSKFALTLGRAQAELDIVDRGLNAFETRMNNILDIREEKIGANRKTHLIRQAAKGAAWGVGFSAAGMLVGSMLPGSAKAGGFSAGNEAQTEVMSPSPESQAIIAPETQKGAAVIANEHVPPQGGADVETIIHDAKAGDNLTTIIKERLEIVAGLSSLQQENVIQNFIQSVTPEELKSIGITDVNHINVGDKIDIGKLNEVLLSKRVSGQDLFTHARELLSASPASAASETIPEGAGQLTPLSKEIIGTLSAPETLLIEKFIGRSISGSESNVLHSMKALSHLTQNEAESKYINDAFTHLELAMREAGRPLTMAEMQRILAGHGSIDTLIEFPEVPQKAASGEAVAATTAETLPAAPTAAEQIPRARAGAPLEAAPSTHAAALTPEQIVNWNNYTEMQKVPLAQGAAETYLKLDADRLYGTDMLGRPSSAWLTMANRSATEVFGVQGERIAPTSASDPTFTKIWEYTKEQGFIKAKGYEPIKGETVEQFLKRSHAMKVLEDGPRRV